MQQQIRLCVHSVCHSISYENSRDDSAAVSPTRRAVIPVATIARLNYDADTAPHAATPELLKRHLRAMHDELVRLALLNGTKIDWRVSLH